MPIWSASDVYVRTGVPLLSDLPLVGGLFGGTRTRTTETELYLFITPTIILSDDAATEATERRLPESIEISLPTLFPADSIRLADIDSVPNLTMGDTLDIPRRRR